MVVSNNIKNKVIRAISIEKFMLMLKILKTRKEQPANNLASAPLDARTYYFLQKNLGVTISATDILLQNLTVG